MSATAMTDTDTIAAIATAPGRGGVGIIRLSGNQALAIGQALTTLQLKPRYATFSTYSDSGGNALDLIRRLIKWNAPSSI